MDNLVLQLATVANKDVLYAKISITALLVLVAIIFISGNAYYHVRQEHI
jgi:hypothetical protein